MNVDFTKIFTLFRVEMRMILRDRRTVFASILLPLLITPLMFFSSNVTAKKRETKLAETVYLYAITGTNADFARNLVAECRRNLASAKSSTNQFHFQETNCPAPFEALQNGEIHFILEGRLPAEIGISDATNHATNIVKHLGSVPGVSLQFRANSDESATAMHKMVDLLDTTQLARQTALLQKAGFSISLESAIPVKSQNVASQSQVAGLSLGRWLTLLMLFFVVMGGMVVATDMLAGEKERGTLETLLTTSISRVEIIAAKLLAIIAVAIAITFIQSANLMLYATLKFLPLPPHFAEALPPATVLLLFFLFTPVAALSSGILLLTSGYARSYKEAQLYFMPVFLLLLVPALAPLLPGAALRSAFVLLPIANLSLAVRDILVGSFDWPMILIAWITTLLAAAGVARATVRLLSEEKRITATESDAVDFHGGEALFSRQAPVWFAVMWGLLLVVSNIAPKMDLRIQLIINLVVIFFGGSVLMLRKYNLDPRVALALRFPKPIVFLAVLIGVPGGMLSGVGLYRLANLVFPVSDKVMEDFASALLPANMGMAQIIFFMAILPGIFEEITFRGLLLHSLSRRLHPALLVIVVGIVFGFFHMAFFRLAPTAFLGIVLACVTLLTGSIFPAMLWHMLNNAAALLSDTQSALAQLEATQYLAGPVLLACAFWILWKNRTPYPGLRPWRRQRPATPSR